MSFVERMKSARNKAPEKAVEARIEKGRTTKERLFSIIAGSDGDEGKTSAELRSEMKLRRDRVHSICKEFIDEGILLKTGKYGKYRLTPKAFEDASKKGFFFGSKILKGSFFSEHISANNKFCKTKYIQDILDTIDKEYNRDPKIKDKLALFEFALSIGATITLEMIMGIKFASDISEVNAKDRAAWKWIDSVINPGAILARFADIPEIERKLKRSSTKERPYPFYDMDSKDVASLMQDFNDVFPEVYKKCEEILSGLEGRIESARQHAKEMDEKDRRMETEDSKHAKCDGQLIPEIKTRVDDTKVQQCAKCHRWIKMKKPKSTA